MTKPTRTIAALAAAACLAPIAALSQDEEGAGRLGPFEVSANVAWTTDYRWRGVSFSDGDFAVQGGFDAAHSSGFYAGVWASSIEEYGATQGVLLVEVLDENGGPGTDALPTFLSGAETELDVYGGFAGEAGALGYDVGVIWYTYPGSSVDTDYAEVYGSLSAGAGPGALTGGVGYIWDQDNTFGGDNIYVFGDYSANLGGTGLTLDAHLGYTDGAFALDGTQFDWLVGLSYELAGLTFQAAYVATDADTDVDASNIEDPALRRDVEDSVEDILGHTAIFTVSKSF